MRMMIIIQFDQQDFAAMSPLVPQELMLIQSFTREGTFGKCCCPF